MSLNPPIAPSTPAVAATPVVASDATVAAREVLVAASEDSACVRSPPLSPFCLVCREREEMAISWEADPPVFLLYNGIIYSVKLPQEVPFDGIVCMADITGNADESDIPREGDDEE
jgi:hypothetical protein